MSNVKKPVVIEENKKERKEKVIANYPKTSPKPRKT